jgi:hypothetical protein
VWATETGTARLRWSETNTTPDSCDDGRTEPRLTGAALMSVRCHQPAHNRDPPRRTITQSVYMCVACRLAGRQDATGCGAAGVSNRCADKAPGQPAFELYAGTGVGGCSRADFRQYDAYPGDGVGAAQLLAGSLPSPRTLRSGITHNGKVNWRWLIQGCRAD